MRKGLILIIALISYTFGYAQDQNDTIRFTPPKKLSNQLNSSAEESLPIFSPDGKMLFFTRTFHPGNVGGKFSGQDIWISRFNEGEFTDAEGLADLNDKWSNAVVGISDDGQKLFLLHQATNGRASVPGVSVSAWNESEQKWGEPETMVVPELNVKATFYSAYVASDESFILWSLPTTEVDSTGNDLFVSTKNGEGWNAPMTLGASINTDLNEISPFYHTGTELLFFSTNGRGSEDNYDIYYSKKLDSSWQEWSIPEPFSYNSSDFDSYFFMTSDSVGYFSSNRNDSLSNIFLTDIIIESAIDTLEEDTAEVIKEPVLIVEKGGEETKNTDIGAMTLEELLDEETKIRFVYFEYDKYNITATYIKVLDAVADILDKYPQIYVKIDGHTDAVASDAYNQILSDNRAASVKEWLLINGVEPDRVKTEGFGEREPLTTNATAEGRAKNRRVEIYFREL